MIQTVKQNKKSVLAFLLALVMLIGLIPFTTTEVQALNTISTGDTFEHGDQINVYCVGSDKSVIYTASVSEGVTTWTSDEKLFFAPGNTTIIACYPLRTHLSRVSLPLDQSTEAKVKSADHMTALSSDTLPSEPVDLHFKHLMAKITVKYKLDTEFDAGTPITKAEIYSRHTEFHTFYPADGYFRKSLAPNWITSWISGNEFTAIVSPEAYSAGDDFIRVTIGDQVLTAKMKEDITFEEGTHYTFDLKVGKDKVTIEQVSVNGNDPSVPFGDGWRSDTEEDLGAVSITDTQDEGKTAWYDGDQIIATLTSQYYGKQTAMLTFSGSDGTWSTDESFSYLENETPTVKAVYAPSKILGTGEYIEFDCELNGAELTVKLESATRNYSRLRIVGLPNQTLTVDTTKFTPAGATEVATAAYTLTTDNNGNAFLYGVFAEGATVSVKQGNLVLKEYAFTANKHPGGTEHGKSYVLGAMPVIDGTLGGKTEATEDDINALVEQLKAYVDNGITTIVIPGTEYAMYKSNLGTIPAYAEALYLLTDLNEDSPYCGTIDLILPDATEIVDHAFDSADALKSITLPKVTTVGDGAFYGCYYLEKMTFGSVVTAINHNTKAEFHWVGKKVEGCNLVLNREQVNAATEYQPNVETKTWWNTEWKSITLE